MNFGQHPGRVALEAVEAHPIQGRLGDERHERARHAVSGAVAHAEEHAALAPCEEKHVAAHHVALAPPDEALRENSGQVGRLGQEGALNAGGVVDARFDLPTRGFQMDQGVVEAAFPHGHRVAEPVDLAGQPREIACIALCRRRGRGIVGALLDAHAGIHEPVHLIEHDGFSGQTHQGVIQDHPEGDVTCQYGLEGGFIQGGIAEHESQGSGDHKGKQDEAKFGRRTEVCFHGPDSFDASLAPFDDQASHGCLLVAERVFVWAAAGMNGHS